MGDSFDRCSWARDLWSNFAIDELLTQGQVLESELAVAAENEGKESE